MKEFMHYFFSVMDKADLKNFKKYIAVVFVASIFSVLGIGAIIPFINVLIQPEKITTFWMFASWQYKSIIFSLTVLLITAYLIKNLVSFALLSYQSNFLFGLTGKIQKKLFTGYMSLPYEYHLNRNTADLIKNVNIETSMLGTYVTGPLGTFLTESMSTFFVMLVLFYVNPLFTFLVSFFLLLSIFSFMKGIKKKVEYYSVLRTECLSSMTDKVLSGLNGIKEAKLYHCEDFFIKPFANNVSNLKLSSAFQLTFQQAPRMLIEFIGLSVVMLVLCGFILSGSKAEDLFVLLGVFGIAAAQLLPGLNRLTQALVLIKYGMPTLKIIHQELDKFKNSSVISQYNDVVQKLDFNRIISAYNLSYVYSDGTQALDCINIDIPKGKRIALVGCSGAGKTTFVDLLLGLYLPTNGGISVDGFNVNNNDMVAYQKLFSYIPQSIILYDKSIKENIAFGYELKDINENLVRDCLNRACLTDFINSLKDKENTYIGEGGIRLSGGQRQRLGIARALYQNSEILIMDEATSALDYTTESQIMDLFLKLKNITIITIAHRLTTIRYYDLIYVFDKGKVVSFGTYDELQEKCEHFQKMLNASSKNIFKTEEAVNA